MGTRALDNRARRLKEIEAQIKELETQADAIKSEIKEEMESQGIDEVHTPNFVIRFKEIVSQKFDSKKFQADNMALYKAYLKHSTTKRFTVA